MNFVMNFFLFSVKIAPPIEARDTLNGACRKSTTDSRLPFRVVYGLKRRTSKFVSCDLKQQVVLI